MNGSEELKMLLQKEAITQEEAFAFFDSLPSFPIENLCGNWKGWEIPTGHPFDGVLTATKWYGKYFENVEDSFPLMYQKKNKKFFYINPRWVPLKLIQFFPRWVISFIFPLVSIFVCTKKSSATLRNIEYRNCITSTMVYDEKPIIDYFKMVDDKTIFATSVMKWNPIVGQFFTLSKVEEF